NTTTRSAPRFAGEEPGSVKYARSAERLLRGALSTRTSAISATIPPARRAWSKVMAPSYRTRDRSANLGPAAGTLTAPTSYRRCCLSARHAQSPGQRRRTHAQPCADRDALPGGARRADVPAVRGDRRRRLFTRCHTRTAGALQGRAPRP